MSITAPTLAYANTFLPSYARMPAKVRKKFDAFLDKFQADPTAASIDFEKLNSMRDDKVRTVRIGLEYRAVLIQPPTGNVCLVAWIDHHDKAHAWAQNRRWDIHPDTGQIQSYVVTEETESVAAEAAPEASAAATDEDPLIPAGRLFAGWRDSDLRMLGVPVPLLPSARSLRREVELDELADYVPDDIIDALYGLASGLTPDQVLEEMGRSKAADEEIDTEDFGAALQRDLTKQHFVTIDDDHDLAAMLRAPLQAWRVFLHPTQRTLARWDVNGPIRVLGAAGTGKTVVLMHRARYLATEKLTAPTDRILVTTFTRNLAATLRRQLQDLCSEDAFSRLHVENLHRWAFQFLRRQGISPNLASRAQVDRAWTDVIDSRHGTLELADTFYRDEFEKVVQANDLTERSEYLRFPRSGRGTPLTRKQRAHAWTVFQAYRELLDERGLMESADAVREARLHLERSDAKPPFDAVLADEAQDFGAAELRLLRALTPAGPNDMFLVGDAHQRIYGHKTTFSQAGIEIRGRSKRLRINYRTTDRIRKRAVATLDGQAFDDLDGNTDTLDGYRSLRQGEEPTVEVFPHRDAELQALVARVNAYLADESQGAVRGPEIVVAARTNSLADAAAQALEDAGVATHRLSEADDDGGNDGVRIATMHRLKGLEFRVVVLVGVEQGVVPLPVPASKTADAVAADEHELAERSLLYVAATRARDALHISAAGTLSPLLPT